MTIVRLGLLFGRFFLGERKTDVGAAQSKLVSWKQIR